MFLWGAICQNIQLEYMALGIRISYRTGKVRVRVGQVNRVSGAVYSNWSQDTIVIYHDI